MSLSGLSMATSRTFFQKTSYFKNSFILTHKSTEKQIFSHKAAKDAKKDWQKNLDKIIEDKIIKSIFQTDWVCSMNS